MNAEQDYTEDRVLLVYTLHRRHL